MDNRWNELQAIREFYNSGATRTYAFRKQQLLALKQAVLRYETEINKALFTDLGKSAEEVYGTEIGLVLADINLAVKKLHKWMRPRRAATNLVNLPSSSKIYHDPLGVVLIISPWNYPFQLLLIPLIGAIAAGNCAVIKPSELAPATAAIIEKIISEIYPPKYIKTVQGDGSTVVPAMMQSFRFDQIFYTGSVMVGKIIYQLAAPNLIPVVLELGGKNAAVIEEDANITIGARRVAIGKFVNAGQSCTAPDYVLVHTSVKEKFIEELKKTLSNFYSDDPLSSYSYGRIINEKRFDRLISYLSQGKIIYGGQYNRERLFIAPTIIENATFDSALMNDEIFGPILPVIGFTTREEASAIIQRQPTPLSFYVFTTDKKKEKEWIEKVAFGAGCVNNTAWQFTNHHLPFGGIGNSGMGAYHGKYSFDVFSHAKPVMKTPLWIDPKIKYPPFEGKLKWFKRFIK